MGIVYVGMFGLQWPPPHTPNLATPLMFSSVVIVYFGLFFVAPTANTTDTVKPSMDSKTQASDAEITPRNGNGDATRGITLLPDDAIPPVNGDKDVDPDIARELQYQL